MMVAELVGVAVLVGIAFWSIRDYIQERRRVSDRLAEFERVSRVWALEIEDRAQQQAAYRAEMDGVDGTWDNTTDAYPPSSLLAAISHCDCGWCSGETTIEGDCACSFCEHRRANEEMEDRFP